MLFRNVIVICAVVLGAAFAVAEPVTIGPGAQPRVVSQGDRVAVVFGRPGEIFIASSADAGKTFEKPRSVATVWKMPLGMRRGPRVVMTEKTMVITAIEGEQ